MRVLFCSWAQTGHYQPLVPLGWALRSAGHEVAVLTHPAFAPVVTASGLTAVPVGPDIDVGARLRERFAALAAEAAPGPGPTRVRDLPENRTGRETLSSAVDGCFAMLDDALAFTDRWRPDLVVFEPTGFLGAVLATLRGVPGVRVLWAPDVTAGLQAMNRRLFGPEFLDRFGIDDVDVTGTVTLDPCPADLQVRDRLPRTPVRYIGYPGPLPGAPAALTTRGRRRRVCLTWGTTSHGLGLHDAYLAPGMLRALARLDVDVVLAVRERELPEFGDLPANVVHAGPVPLRAVLPACDAVVHQGSGGTTMTAVVSGTPQLVVPVLADAAANATCLVASGAGVRLDPDADPVQVRHRVEALLADPAPTRRAAELAAEAAAMPTPAEIVPLLADLAA